MMTARLIATLVPPSTLDFWGERCTRRRGSGVSRAISSVGFGARHEGDTGALVGGQAPVRDEAAEEPLERVVDRAPVGPGICDRVLATEPERAARRSPEEHVAVGHPQRSRRAQIQPRVVAGRAIEGELAGSQRIAARERGPISERREASLARAGLLSRSRVFEERERALRQQRLCWGGERRDVLSALHEVRRPAEGVTIRRLANTHAPTLLRRRRSSELARDPLLEGVSDGRQRPEDPSGFAPPSLRPARASGWPTTNHSP